MVLTDIRKVTIYYDLDGEIPKETILKQMIFFTKDSKRISTISWPRLSKGNVGNKNEEFIVPEDKQIIGVFMDLGEKQTEVLSFGFILDDLKV